MLGLSIRIKVSGVGWWYVSDHKTWSILCLRVVILLFSPDWFISLLPPPSLSVQLYSLPDDILPFEAWPGLATSLLCGY